MLRTRCVAVVLAIFLKASFSHALFRKYFEYNYSGAAEAARELEAQQRLLYKTGDFLAKAARETRTEPETLEQAVSALELLGNSREAALKGVHIITPPSNENIADTVTEHDPTTSLQISRLLQSKTDHNEEAARKLEDAARRLRTEEIPANEEAEPQESKELRSENEEEKKLEDVAGQLHTGEISPDIQSEHSEAKELENAALGEAAKKLEDVAGRLRTGDITPNTEAERNEEGELRTAVNQEKSNKLQDVAGRLGMSQTPLSAQELQEQEELRRLKNLGEQERCLASELSKLQDVAGRLQVAEGGTTASEEELEADELRRLKAAEDDAAKEKAERHPEDAAPPVPDEPELEEELQAAEEEEAAAGEHAAEEECEDKNEMEVLKKEELEKAQLPIEPAAHEEQLETLEAAATNESELASVEASAAEADATESQKLLSVVDSDIEAGEALDAAAEKEIEEASNDDPCVANRADVKGVEDAKAAKGDADDAKNKLHDVELLLQEADDEVDAANRAVEDAEAEDCPDPVKIESAKKKAADAKDKANGVRVSLDVLQKRVVELEEVISEDMDSAKGDLASNLAACPETEKECEEEEDRKRATPINDCPPPSKAIAACITGENHHPKQQVEAEQADRLEDAKIESVTSSPSFLAKRRPHKHSQSASSLLPPVLYEIQRAFN